VLRDAHGVTEAILRVDDEVMRIAQVAPLHEACPPRFYGGTERVVSYLTEELVRAGHDVTLFASGDSETTARLEPICGRALRLNSAVVDPLIYHMIMFNRVAARAAQFDVVHFHTDYLHFASVAALARPMVTTLHGRLDLPDLPAIYSEFSNLPLVSISNSQRRPLPWANWRATVPHGLPCDLYTLGSGAGGYLAFIGRISPEKRLDRAIEVAQRTGLPLKIAAKIDRVDRDYFDAIIAPSMRRSGIEFLGEISEAEKGMFLGQAAALLFPIDWPEPFGLAMIEAMANGTPVIAFRCGAVPEVIDDGVSGLIVDSVEEAVAAVPRVLSFSRPHVRHQFERRFCGARMARDYLAVYDRLRQGRASCRHGVSRTEADDMVPAN
jgi:glycosyltransferase involved in cell wall biosynthesis